MSVDLVNPDFAAFARSFGAHGERGDTPDILAALVKWALAADTAPRSSRFHGVWRSTAHLSDAGTQRG